MNENDSPAMQPLARSSTVDTWVWGTERVLWGFDAAHQYTFKVLEPHIGAPGCMSLQYHREKSESWLILRGAIWALFLIEGVVCTRVMRARDGQHITPGMVHRLAGLSADAQVIEPSTPDRHAADKNVTKDVVRLHCLHGRDCVAGRDDQERRLIAHAIAVTEKAMSEIAAGRAPEEHNTDILKRYGAFTLP